MRGRLFGALAIASAFVLTARSADLPALLAERLKCVVAVEYVIDSESERRPTVAYGTVADSSGTIILPSGSIDEHLPPDQLKDFKVYLPGEETGYDATYLGEDAFTGWDFVRAPKNLLPRLVPVTAFAAKGGSPEPAVAEELWGIGLRPKEEDFMPYLMQSHLSLIQSLPERTGITQQEIAGPGLPVFNRDGTLVGLAVNSFGYTYMMFSQMNHGGAPIVLVDVEESSAFSFADEVLPYLDRIPRNVNGRPLAWLGAFGLESVAPEVADLLKLSDRSGVVVSEVLASSPAEAAGMKDHDIIVGIDGKQLPRFKPDHVVDYVEREIERRRPGDIMSLEVQRGADRLTLKATLGDEPELAREAKRRYFDRIGLTIREFVYGDAIERRLSPSDATGVIVHYVKPNSPAAIAGLTEEDWLKEIDGTPVKDFAAAANLLSTIQADPLRTDCVVLAARGGDTAVLRIKLR
jgi:serine protease Do